MTGKQTLPISGGPLFEIKRRIISTNMESIEIL